MYGLMSTLPVSPPPAVGSVASNSGSGVSLPVQVEASPLEVAGWHSPLSVTLVTAAVEVTWLPASSMSWNEPAVTAPPSLVGRSGPL